MRSSPRLIEPARPTLRSIASCWGDWKPYAYRTEDYGQSWTLLTTGKNGIPADTPVRVVREDPAREGLLYAGCEFGLYVSFDDGENWQSLQRNLPVTPTTDMKVFRNDLVISTMGRSFWILDDLTPLHQLNPAVARSNVHLFNPRDAFRMRYREGRPGRGAEYLEAGALIHYALAEDADEVTLEILDAGGKSIRKFTNKKSEERGKAKAGGGKPDAVKTPKTDPKSKTKPSNEKAEGQEGGMRGPRRPPASRNKLARTAGMHRFVWDLRRQGAGGAGRRGGRGPLVVPGGFQVRLSVGSEVRRAPVRVLIDPRVAADGVTIVDLRAQQELLLRIQALRSPCARDLEPDQEASFRAGGEDQGRRGATWRQRSVKTERWPRSRNGW